jgi:hypothetical protein
VLRSVTITTKGPRVVKVTANERWNPGPRIDPGAMPINPEAVRKPEPSLTADKDSGEVDRKPETEPSLTI